MFLFPLGLKAKTRQFPAATVAVIVVTVIYSVLHLADLDRAALAIANGSSASELVPARNKLALANCQRLSERLRLTKEDCEFLDSILDTETPQRYQEFVSETHAALEAQFNDEAAHKVASLEKILFSDEFWQENQAELLESEEYKQYLSRRGELESERGTWQNEHNLLSLSNLSLRSLTDSNLAHAGWLHLIVNMALLLFLAIAVEERIGSFTFLTVYLLGGVIGNLAHLMLSALITEILPQKEWQVLLGASGNIAAIAGAYWVLFWNLKVRFMVFRRKQGRGIAEIYSTVFIPLYFLGVFVLGCLTGGENVAKASYLGGVLVGITIGLIWRRLRPVNTASVFPFEDRLIGEVETVAEISEKLTRLAEVLYHHPENREALDLSLVTVLQEATVPWEELDPKTKRFIKRNFESIFCDRLKRDNESEFVEFAAAIPSDWPLEKILRKIEFATLQPVIAQCQTQGRFEVAARLLRVLCGLSDGRLRLQLEQYLDSVEKEVANAPQAS